jgi:hypothetical protein
MLAVAAIPFFIFNQATFGEMTAAVSDCSGFPFVSLDDCDVEGCDMRQGVILVSSLFASIWLIVISGTGF